MRLNHCHPLAIFLVAALAQLAPKSSSSSKTNTQEESNSNKLFPPLSDGPDFRVEARIKVTRKTSNEIDLVLSLSEYYSNVQHRARLDLNFKSRQEAGIEYFYDGVRMLKVNSTLSQQNKCQSANANQLTQDLFGENSSIEGINWLHQRDNVPEFAIGVIRLLFIIEANRDKLEQLPDYGEKIRNHEIVKYKLEAYIDSNTNPSVLTASYDMNTVDRWTETRIPLQISVELSIGTIIVVDYALVEPINFESSSSFVNKFTVGLFTFPPGIGCSSQLEPASLLNDDTIIIPRVISLRADVIEAKRIDYINYEHPSTSDDDVSSNYRKHFLAYDGYAKSLRLDTIRAAVSNEYTIAIYDLSRDLRFNIRQKRILPSGSAGVSREDYLMIGLVAADDGGSRSQCAVAGLFSESDTHENLYEPLFPFDKFVYMGIAICRGVKVQCFEHQTNTLPPMISQMFNYVELDANHNSFYLPYLLVGNKQVKTSYTITYYFAIATNSHVKGQFVGPLMHVNVVNQQGLNVFKADIYDFIWQLADAPNGDHQDELFELKNRCADKSNRDDFARSARLNMVLEFKKVTQRSLAAHDVAKIINSSSVRNKALLRAMRASSSNLAATQIQIIESKTRLVSIDQDQKLTIHVQARLNDNILEVYEPLLIGPAIISSNIESVETSAMTLDECFWDALHKRRHSSDLVFTYCRARCLIDDNVQTTTSLNGGVNVRSRFFISKTQIQHPIIMSLSTCELFKLVSDKHRSKPMLTLAQKWKSIRDGLRSKIFRLPVLNVTDSGTPAKYLAFEVKELKLSNDKWLTSLDDYNSCWRDNEDDSDKVNGDDELNKGTLEGLGFSLNNGVQKVEASIISSFSLYQGTTMNFEACHSSCMANLSCSSFSFCIIGQEVECLVSDSFFRNSSSLLAQIKPKLSELKGRRGTISVGVETVEDGGSKQTRQFKLRVDSRCRIYKKNPLELFRRRSKAFMQVVNKNLMPAQNQEECADICLKNNIRFFARPAKARMSMLRERNTTTDQEYWTRIRNDGEKSWCARFLFINLANVAEVFKAKLSPEQLNTSGLCQLNRIKWNINAAPKTTIKDKERKETIESKVSPVFVQIYEFIYKMLYERHYGIKILQADQIESQKDAFEVDGAVTTRDNNQIISDQTEVEDCARSCFTQSIGLRPWCKSFDFIEDRSQGLDKDTMEFRIKTYCVFNTITLAKARQQSQSLQKQLISTNLSRHIKFWHYEPSNSYIFDDDVWKGHQLKEGSDVDKQTSDSFRLSKFGTLIAVILSTVSGWILGVKLGARIDSCFSGSRRESIHNPSRSFLSSLVGSDDMSSDSWHRRFDADFDLPESELPIDSIHNTNEEQL